MRIGLLKETTLCLVFTHVMRRPCWCTKHWQNVTQVLHNDRIKFPKDFFRYCLYTNIAAVTSPENRELGTARILKEGAGLLSTGRVSQGGPWLFVETWMNVVMTTARAQN